jgi:transcriptional antiterminator RfaH
MPGPEELEIVMSSLNGEHSLRWYAIHTHPKQEVRAESNLLSWNIETFLPKYKSGRQNQLRMESRYSVKPLFPGYIFARFRAGDMFHKIRYTRGVHSIVSMGNSPVPLDDPIIEMIMSRQDGDGFVTLEDDIKSGDEVVVSGGVFSGFVGVFDRRMRDSERVVILLKTAYQFRVVVPEMNVTSTRSNHLRPFRQLT